METMVGTGIDTTVLAILGTAFGVVFATITTLMFGSMRYQHRDSIQTRQLITQTNNQNLELIDKNRELIQQSNNKNRELIEQATEKLTANIDEHRRVVERNHDKVVASLGDVRERLARIEGGLGIGVPPTSDSEQNGDSEAA